MTGESLPFLEEDLLERIIEEALHEDLAFGDLTTGALVDQGSRSSAALIAREEAVLAGIEVLRRVFLKLDPGASFKADLRDGDSLAAGRRILRVAARTDALLKGERTALNFIQHLSGVATRTRAFVRRLEGLPTILLDTRKTTPGLRALEKYAVRVGGGRNHRFGLFDGIIIKDNHRAIIGDLAAAVRTIKELYPLKAVEVECADTAEVEEALDAGAEIIMLDNMKIGEMARAVELAAGRCRLEASGNIGLENIREVASTGVDYISAGSIIHGAVFVDMSMEMDADDPPDH